MIGLGVGIDYALFIVTRHRQHLHEGMSVADAAGTANATAGRPCCSPARPSSSRSSACSSPASRRSRSMGIVGGAGRRRRDDGRRSRCCPACSAWPERRSTSCRSTASRTWPSPRTRRSPVAGPTTSAATRCATRIASFVALCAIAVPALEHAHRHARRRQRGQGTRPSATRTTCSPTASAGASTARSRSSSTSRPPPTGRPSPVSHDALRADPGVAAVTAPVFNAAGDTAVLTVNPTTAPQDARTDALVHHLRSDVLPATVAGHRTPGRCSPARRWSPTSPSASPAACRSSSPRSWRCRSCC